MKLIVRDDGISCITVDSEHYMLISTKLRKESFVVYDTQDKEFGIDIKKCIDILKLGKPKDFIMISDNDNKLYFNLGQRAETSKIDTTDFSDPNIPKIEFRNYAIIEKSMIEPTINYCKKDVNVNIFFDMNEFGIRLYAVDDIDKLDYPISKSKILEYYYKDKSLSRYDGGYLSMILRYLPDKNIKISTVGNNYPIKIGYSNSDMEGFTLLAPTIENDCDPVDIPPELNQDDYEDKDDNLW